jgi:hypothetical protein
MSELNLKWNVGGVIGHVIEDSVNFYTSRVETQQATMYYYTITTKLNTRLYG